jgi:hypothetical protein
MARQPLAEGDGQPEWVTLDEAARRLGMSVAWFSMVAKEQRLHTERRGRQPGVDWTDVERYIERS